MSGDGTGLSAPFPCSSVLAIGDGRLMLRGEIRLVHLSPARPDSQYARQDRDDRQCPEMPG
jgi:hypothetical protein